jgi:dienelactone hydrolase
LFSSSIHKYDIRTVKGHLSDASRQSRKVPYKVYYPRTDNKEKFPLIIWSHGLGGSRDGASFISRFIASHGYVVLHITHIGTDTSIWEGKAGHPWDVIRATKISRKATLNRFKDVPFILDNLKQLEVIDLIDVMKVGMCGHSFGAITTQVLSGQMLGRGRRKYSLKDDRIIASICYSMSPTYNHGEDHHKIYGSISVPMMFMTGTEDESPITGESYHYRLPIYEYSQGPHQHLLILEGADHMVFAGSRGKLPDNDQRESLESLIRDLSLVFWQAYLKNDDSALAFITSTKMQDALDKQVIHKFKL